MHSNERMLSILDLFDADNPEWTFEEMHGRLGFARSTLYRYLKLLADAELLSSLPGRGYTLGPRIIELDYQIMATDPLIHFARPMMSELVSRHACVSLLCRRYKHRVLCVHQEASTSTFRSTYERGKARPLLRGAASLAILAYFSTYQLAKLHEEQSEEFRRAGLGETLQDVRESLKPIRQKGWVHTFGEVTPGVTGIAAPIFDARNDIAASVSLTLPEPRMSEERLLSIGKQVEFCARVITKSLR